MVLPRWAFWAAAAAMVVGLVGVILPVIPGVGLVWIVMLIYALAEGFATIDPVTFGVLTVLAAIGVTADLWMTQAGAKIGGASIWSLLAGMGMGLVGALIGAIFLGVGAVPGALLGTLLGIVLAEYYRNRNWDEALKVAGGYLVGCVLSGGVQFVIAVLMIVIFAWQALKG